MRGSRLAGAVPVCTQTPVENPNSQGRRLCPGRSPRCPRPGTKSQPTRPTVPTSRRRQHHLDPARFQPNSCLAPFSLTTLTTEKREASPLSPSEGKGRRGWGGSRRGLGGERWKLIPGIAFPGAGDGEPPGRCRLLRTLRAQNRHLRSQAGPPRVRRSPPIPIQPLTLSCSEEPRAQNRQHRRQEQRLGFPPRSHVCRYSTRTRHRWLFSDAPASSEERQGYGQSQMITRGQGEPERSRSRDRPRIRRLLQVWAPGSLPFIASSPEPLQG